MPKVLVSPNDTRITGSLERVLGIAQIESFDDDGEPNYGGYTNIDWDSQATIRREGAAVYTDEDGEEYLSRDCRLMTEEEFLALEEQEDA